MIEDHDAIEGQCSRQQANLHRISHDDVPASSSDAGFRLDAMIGSSTAKYDDRRMNVFFPGVRGRTDRFIAVFIKPQD